MKHFITLRSNHKNRTTTAAAAAGLSKTKLLRTDGKNVQTHKEQTRVPIFQYICYLIEQVHSNSTLNNQPALWNTWYRLFLLPSTRGNVHIQGTSGCEQRNHMALCIYSNGLMCNVHSSIFSSQNKNLHSSTVLPHLMLHLKSTISGRVILLSGEGSGRSNRTALLAFTYLRKGRSLTRVEVNLELERGVKYTKLVGMQEKRLLLEDKNVKLHPF